MPGWQGLERGQLRGRGCPLGCQPHTSSNCGQCPSQKHTIVNRGQGAGCGYLYLSWVKSWLLPHAVLHYITLCRPEPCNAVGYCTTPGYTIHPYPPLFPPITTLHRALQCYTIPHCALHRSTRPRSTIPCYSLLSCTRVHDTVLYRIILYYTILHSTRVYYSVLHCTVYHAILYLLY